jgi:MFS family permease
VATDMRSGHEVMTATTAGQPSEAVNQTAYPSLWRASYAVFVLMLVTFTALLDRYLPAIALGPMKSDLGLTDTSISIVQGVAFSLFYCVAGVPLGRAVDTYNRRNLVVMAVIVWTVLTLWSGLAGSFAELFFARAGIGIAEAILAPATYSIIADSFPPHKRGRAIGIYFSSLIVGSSCSFIIGGRLLAFLAETPIDFPIVGILSPWRGTFVLLALLGIPAAIAALTMREPERREVQQHSDKNGLIAFLREKGGSMALLYGTFGLFAFVSVIAVSWAPTLYNRNFGVSLAQSAVMVGLAILIGGVVGALISGWFSDRFVRRPGPGRFKVQMLSAWLSVPLLTLWPLMPSTSLSYPLLILSTTTITFGMSSIAATLQDVAPNQLRGQLIAINYIVMMLTSGLTPTAVAVVTDSIFGNDTALPWSMALVGGIFCAISYMMALMTARRYASMRLSVPTA